MSSNTTERWSEEAMMIRHTGEQLHPERGRKFVDYLKILGKDPQFKINNNVNHPIFGILLRFVKQETGERMTPRQACDWIGFKRCDPMFPSATLLRHERNDDGDIVHTEHISPKIGNYQFIPMYHLVIEQRDITAVAEFIEKDYLN